MGKEATVVVKRLAGDLETTVRLLAACDVVWPFHWQDQPYVVFGALVLPVEETFASLQWT